MYSRSKTGAFLFALILLASVLLGGTAVAGFSVQNGVLLDGNGAPFVMRGVNYPHVWYTSRTPQAVSDMAGVGVNAVRVVLGSGKQWGPTPASEVKSIIEQLKSRKMIAVLEVHDCTGYGEKGEAAPMSTAVDYWLSIQEVLKGQEDYVIINIANEPLGNNVAQSEWADSHTRAIRRLRSAGLTHTLMVDAANWGQDWEKIMYNNAPQVFNADPRKNIVFSVHMYQVYSSRSTIDDYISKFVNQHKLPLVVGEFGADHQGQDVDEASILELADQYGIGYLGWSWSGNSGGTESLDITINFNVNNLSSWGNTLINSTYGIRNTAEPATIFTDGSGGPAADTGGAPVKIMALGDSITSSPGCWRALLWKDLTENGFANIDFVGTQRPDGCGFQFDGEHEGHPGVLVTNVAANNELVGWLSATHPDVVMMHFGTNDVWSNRSTQQILDAYTTLVNQMRQDNPQIKILVAQIIPVAPDTCADCPQRTIALNNEIPAWAESLSTASSPIVVVDHWTGFNSSTDTYDGVHPNDAGIRKLADNWYGPLTEILGGNSSEPDTGGPTDPKDPTEPEPPQDPVIPGCGTTSGCGGV